VREAVQQALQEALANPDILTTRAAATPTALNAPARPLCAAGSASVCVTLPAAASGGGRPDG
jgi:hypothetical protein